MFDVTAYKTKTTSDYAIIKFFFALITVHDYYFSTNILHLNQNRIRIFICQNFHDLIEQFLVSEK